MTKIVFLMIIAGLAVVAFAAININDVNAGQQAEFVQVSVLAEHQADYSTDEQAIVIPAVSVEIIEDAAQDFQTQSSLRVITYTSLPTKEPKPDDKVDDGSESVDESRHDNGQGNGNHGGNANNSNQDNNGNGNETNGNMGNGNPNEKDKGKDREKENKREKNK